MAKHVQPDLYGGPDSIIDDEGYTGPTKVVAATRWTDNAAMIAEAVFPLGWLADDWEIIDPTYGAGGWWKRHRPPALVGYNRGNPGDELRPDVMSIRDWDFRATGHADNHWDAATFDPPYVAMGGRTTSTLDYTGHTYGMEDAPRTPMAVQALIDGGLTEMARIVRPSARQSGGPGVILVKCQNYNSSSRLHPGVYLTCKHAIETLGLRLIGQLEMIEHHRPQPADRAQRNPEHHHSTLLAFRQPTDRKFKQ